MVSNKKNFTLKEYEQWPQHELEWLLIHCENNRHIAINLETRFTECVSAYLCAHHLFDLISRSSKVACMCVICTLFNETLLSYFRPFFFALFVCCFGVIKSVRFTIRRWYRLHQCTAGTKHAKCCYVIKQRAPFNYRDFNIIFVLLFNFFVIHSMQIWSARNSNAFQS